MFVIQKKTSNATTLLAGSKKEQHWKYKQIHAAYTNLLLTNNHYKSMKLFLPSNKPPKPWLSSKTKQTMRLTSVLLISLAFQMSASVSSQNVTFKGNNLSARTVLSILKAQTDYVFFYDREILKGFQPVNLNVQNASIETALKSVFANEAISWNITDKTVFLSTKKQDHTSTLKIQQIVVTGIVTDEKGMPVPGANINVAGTKTGVQTDVNGNFSIEVPNKAYKLVVSFIGMESQEVSIGNAPLSVVLKEQGQKLEDIVVIAFGTSTKKKLVSSIATVKTKEISEAPYSSVVNGLAGRVSGLFVQESGGEFGSLASISIRGAGEPLYVLDGIRTTKEEFSRIPASDIDNISILKDAGATALYGFDAGNGVVLITTNKGGNHKLKFSYSNNTSFRGQTYRPEYQSAYEHAIFKNEAAFNDGLAPIVDDATLNILKNNLDPVRYPKIGTYDAFMKKVTSQAEHNLSLNGSVNGTQVFMSLNSYLEDGVYSTGTHGLKRYSYRTNLSHRFSDIGLTVSGNLLLQHGVRKTPPIGTGYINLVLRQAENGEPLFNPAGNYYGAGNLLALTDDAAGYNKLETNLYEGRLAFDWDVIGVKGLKFSTNANYRFDSSFNKVFRANAQNSAQKYNWDNLVIDMGKASLFESFGRDLSYNLTTRLNYLHTFGQNHTVDLTAGLEQSEGWGDYFDASRRDFVSPAVDQLFAGSEVGKGNNGYGSERGSIGYIGRLKYDFASKYIIEGNFRYDGYDGFAVGHKFGFFPSMSIGWNIDKENFAKYFMDPIGMSSLKLRASIGETGRTGSRFGYLSNYSLLNGNYYIGGEFKPGFAEGGLTPNLDQFVTWYTIESKNAGVDFGFMKNKLTGSFDAFYYRTIGYPGSPASIYTTPLGQSLPQINTKSAHRRGGVELSLNYRTNIDQVKLNFGGNISYFDQLWEKNEGENLTSLKDPRIRITHQKDYVTHGYIDQGYYQTLEDILNSPRRLGSNDTYLGDLKYQDVNGDGLIDGEDQVRIGKSSFAHITYGGTIGAEYNGFSLNALFQGTSNRQIYLGYMYNQGINLKTYAIQLDTWKPDNTDALFPRSSTFNNSNGDNNNRSSTFWLQDAWYIRLKSISLSYDLKYKFLKDMKGIQNCSLLLSGVNLFTISPITKYGLDPETSDGSNISYPVGKTMNIGLRVTF